MCVWKEEAENENLRVFSAKELKKATKRFRSARVVTTHDGSVQTFYKGYINDATSAPSRTKTKIAVSVMELECLQHSTPRPKHVWISKVCQFLTLVLIFIVTLCTYYMWVAGRSGVSRRDISSQLGQAFGLLLWRY